MKKAPSEVILDAEWEEIPNAAPETGLGRIPKAKARTSKGKAPKQRIRAIREKSSVGRVDVLAAGVLNLGFRALTGSPPPPNIANSIGLAASMIFGKGRAKGPEFDFIRGVLGG